MLGKSMLASVMLDEDDPPTLDIVLDYDDPLLVEARCGMAIDDDGPPTLERLIQFDEPIILARDLCGRDVATLALLELGEADARRGKSGRVTPPPLPLFQHVNIDAQIEQLVALEAQRQIDEAVSAVLEELSSEDLCEPPLSTLDPLLASPPPWRPHRTLPTPAQPHPGWRASTWMLVGTLVFAAEIVTGCALLL